jgi:hypothetical protein
MDTSFAAGEKPGGGKLNYCWLVWDQAHNGYAETPWLRGANARPPSMTF